jgi:hypothetical protein
MKTNKDFDFGKWLSERAEKPSVKTVNFSDLTKVEKVETLLALLNKSEKDVEDAPIFGTEERKYGDCSAQARAAILTAIVQRLQAGETGVQLPKDTDVVTVPVRTSYKAASLKDRINYLLSKYGRPVETVTVNLPCGAEWVSGLIDYCKSFLPNGCNPLDELELIASTEKGEPKKPAK